MLCLQLGSCGQLEFPHDSVGILRDDKMLLVGNRLITTDADGRQLAVLSEVSEGAVKQGQVFGAWFRLDLDANYDGLDVAGMRMDAQCVKLLKAFT